MRMAKAASKIGPGVSKSGVGGERQGTFWAERFPCCGMWIRLSGWRCYDPDHSASASGSLRGVRGLLCRGWGAVGQTVVSQPASIGIAGGTQMFAVPHAPPGVVIGQTVHDHTDPPVGRSRADLGGNLPRFVDPPNRCE